MFRPSLRHRAAGSSLVAGIGVVVTGDLQARIMTEQQPMKMAAAEALYDTEQPASFSLFTIGTLDGSEEVYQLRVPRLLSFLATGSSNGKVEGINDLQRAVRAEVRRPATTSPYIPVTYWSFRLMIGFGALGDPGRPGRAVADPARPAAEPVVLPGRDRRDRDAVAGQLVRLDLHRDGPPAVDRSSAC